METQHSAAVREAATSTKAGDLPATLSQFNHMPDCALVGSAVVRAIVGGINEVTLWRWIRAKEFPAPKKLPGGRLNSWRVGDIRKFLAEREADHVAA